MTMKDGRALRVGGDDEHFWFRALPKYVNSKVASPAYQEELRCETACELPFVRDK
jgi:hypothetical protein